MAEVTAVDDQTACETDNSASGNCHRCGCSHEDPGDEGCGWAAENLCTACEEAAAPAPKIAQAEATAVRKVVCQALHESPVADPRTLPPMGAGLRDLARRIGDMSEEASDAPRQA